MANDEPGTVRVIYDVVNRLEAKLDDFLNLGLEHRVRELEAGLRRLRNFFWSLITAVIVGAVSAYLQTKGVAL
jgi:hypothetical protein